MCAGGKEGAMRTGGEADVWTLDKNRSPERERLSWCKGRALDRVGGRACKDRALDRVGGRRCKGRALDRVL